MAVTGPHLVVKNISLVGILKQNTIHQFSGLHSEYPKTMMITQNLILQQNGDSTVSIMTRLWAG